MSMQGLSGRRIPAGYSGERRAYSTAMSTDALHRRLRYAPPAPKVRRLVLTAADYEIFRALARHGPLPSNYLYEFTRHVRRDRSHLQNRLTEFYNGDDRGPLLLRPPQQFATFEARYQHLVYDLAPRVAHLIAEHDGVVVRRADPFVHRLMAACIGASIELSAAGAGLSFIPFPEILANPKRLPRARGVREPLALPLTGSSRQALIPDAVFGLEYPGTGFRFFALEADRNTQSIERRNLGQSAFGQKVAGYVAALENQAFQDWWGIPNLHVLTLTTSERHARNLLDYIAAHAPEPLLHRFGIAVLPGFGANWQVPREVLRELLERPWVTPVGEKYIGRA